MFKLTGVLLGNRGDSHPNQPAADADPNQHSHSDPNQRSHSHSNPLSDCGCLWQLKRISAGRLLP